MAFSVKCAVAHLIFAFLVVLSFQKNGLAIFGQKMLELAQLTPELLVVSSGLVCIGLASNALTRSRPHKEVIAQVCLATVFVSLFQTTFSMVKNSIPHIVPFYADPYLAKIDNVLHFGVDPWELVYWLFPQLPDNILTTVYAKVWTLAALALPLIIAMFDTNPQRVKRTMILYLVAWIFIGNVMAILGSSVGPVFYDQLMNISRFAELRTALQYSGTDDPLFFAMQQSLWWNYENNTQNLGTGISAFPSVHTAIAFVIASYLFDVSKYLLPVSIGLVAGILFLSIYTGYHYAVDGYVSILVMYLVRRWLLRRHPSEYHRHKGSVATRGLTYDPADGFLSRQVR